MLYYKVDTVSKLRSIFPLTFCSRADEPYILATILQFYEDSCGEDKELKTDSFLNWYVHDSWMECACFWLSQNEIEEVVRNVAESCDCLYVTDEDGEYVEDADGEYVEDSRYELTVIDKHYKELCQALGKAIEESERVLTWHLRSGAVLSFRL